MLRRTPGSDRKFVLFHRALDCQLCTSGERGEAEVKYWGMWTAQQTFRVPIWTVSFCNYSFGSLGAKIDCHEEHGSLGRICSWRNLCASGGRRQARGHRQNSPQEGRQAPPPPSCGRGVGQTPRRSRLARGGLESRRAPTAADPGAAAAVARACLQGAWQRQGHRALLSAHCKRKMRGETP